MATIRVRNIPFNNGIKNLDFRNIIIDNKMPSKMCSCAGIKLLDSKIDLAAAAPKLCKKYLHN